MTRTIRLVQRYPHPASRVWRALTESDLLERWLMPNDFQPMVGHRFQFRTRPAPGFDGIVRCEVLEVVAEHRLRFSWVGGGIDTVVLIELAPDGDGTRLSLTQSGFAGVRASAISVLLGNGWSGMLRRKLPPVLDGLARPSDTACGPETTWLWRVLNRLWGR